MISADQKQTSIFMIYNIQTYNDFVDLALFLDQFRSLKSSAKRKLNEYTMANQNFCTLVRRIVFFIS